MKRTWLKMLTRLSLVDNSYVMEKIFAFSVSRPTSLSNAKCIYTPL